MFYILPFSGSLLVGTTDTAFSEDPDAAEPTGEDVAYLRESAEEVLPASSPFRSAPPFSSPGARAPPGGGGAGGGRKGPRRLRGLSPGCTRRRRTCARTWCRCTAGGRHGCWRSRKRPPAECEPFPLIRPTSPPRRASPRGGRGRDPRRPPPPPRR